MTALLADMSVAAVYIQFYLYSILFYLTVQFYLLVIEEEQKIQKKLLSRNALSK